VRVVGIEDRLDDNSDLAGRVRPPRLDPRPLPRFSRLIERISREVVLLERREIDAIRRIVGARRQRDRRTREDQRDSPGY